MFRFLADFCNCWIFSFSARYLTVIAFTHKINILSGLKEKRKEFKAVIDAYYFALVDITKKQAFFFKTNNLFMRKNTVFAWGAFFKCTFQYSQWILLPLAGVQTVHIQLIFISGAIKTVNLVQNKNVIALLSL